MNNLWPSVFIVSSTKANSGPWLTLLEKLFKLWLTIETPPKKWTPIETTRIPCLTRTSFSLQRKRNGPILFDSILIGGSVKPRRNKKLTIITQAFSRTWNKRYRLKLQDPLFNQILTKQLLKIHSRSLVEIPFCKREVTILKDTIWTTKSIRKSCLIFLMI